MSNIFSRETIYAALFTKLQAAATAVSAPTCSRRVLHYSDVPSGMRPALFQFQNGEAWKRVRGLPPTIALKAEFLIYVDSNPEDQTAIPSTTINNVIDAVQAAMAPVVANNNNQDLGLPDVVQHAWVEDAVEVYEGVLLNTSIIIMPIHILLSGGVPS